MPKALSMAGVFSEIGYNPHLVQRRIHRQVNDKRFRVVCAGRRTGKSTLGGHELTIRALQAKLRYNELEPFGHRSEHWIVGPEYSDAEKEFRVLWNDLDALEIPLDHPGSYNDPNGGNMHVSLWGGRFLVHAKSAKYPGTLVGEALEGVILAEAAKLKPSVWTKYIRPTLADHRGWALFSSTPEGKNWFYEQYQRGLRDDANWWSIRMPSWSNDILFPEGRTDPEILDMEAEMTEEKFNQEIGADFTEFVGRVFKDFDEEIHVGHHPYDPSRPVFLATDYGYSNPTVVLFIQIDTWDNVYVIAEYYHTHKTIDEVAQEIWTHPRLGSLVRVAHDLYPDPEDPGSSNYLAKSWQLTVRGSTGGLIRDRVDMIRRGLKIGPEFLIHGHPDRVPKLFFDHGCHNTIREMQDYRYPEVKDEVTQDPKENPLKKDDHCPEALGRFYAGHFSDTVRRPGRARQKTAKTA
jgi:Terminase large subunit, T4likevirus-type, N-terminal